MIEIPVEILIGNKENMPFCTRLMFDKFMIRARIIKCSICWGKWLFDFYFWIFSNIMIYIIVVIITREAESKAVLTKYLTLVLFIISVW